MSEEATPATTEGSPAPQSSAPTPEPSAPEATNSNSAPEHAPTPKERQKAIIDAAREASRKAFQTTEEKGDEPTDDAELADTTAPGTQEPAKDDKDAGTDPNPKDAATEASKASDDRRRKESITVKDRQGKDIEVSLNQARQAILRDGADARFLESMTKTDLLAYGSKRFLAQREQDQFGSQAQQWRREAQGAAKPQTPAQVSPPEQPVAATPPVQAHQQATPEAVAQPSAPATPQIAPQANAKWKEKINSIRAVAGDDVADALESTLSDVMQEIAGTYDGRITKAMQDNQAQIAHINQQYWDGRFESELKGLQKDYPQLADPKVREEAKKNAIAIGQSGRFADPVANFEAIVREGADALLASQSKETAARKLLDRTARRANGQLHAGASRKETPAAALSAKELSRQFMRKHEETGDVNTARTYIKGLAAQRG